MDTPPPEAPPPPGPETPLPAVGDIISAGMRAGMDNAGLFFGLWAIFSFVPQLLGLVLMTAATGMDKTAIARAFETRDWALAFPLAGFWLVMIALQIVGHAATLAGCSRILNGQTPGLTDAIRDGLRRTPSLVAAGIISAFALLLALIAFILPGMYLFVRLSMTSAAIVVEERGPLSALSRAWRVTDGRFVDTAIFLLALFAIACAVMLGLGVAGVIAGLAGSVIGPGGRAAASAAVTALQFQLLAWLALCSVQYFRELAVRTPSAG
jgi:hypothetical protein